MRARGLGGLVLAGVLVWPALAASQGLGDVAARAREEREKKTSRETTEVESFSNEDLEGLSEKTNEDSAGTVSTPTASGVAPPAGGGPSRSSRTPAQLRAAQEQPYQDRVNRARARVEALEAQVETLQQRLNPMSTTYIYGSAGGPVGGTQADEEQRVRSQLTAAEQQLAQARQQLTAAEAALAQGGRGGPTPGVPGAPGVAPAPGGGDDRP